MLAYREFGIYELWHGWWSYVKDMVRCYPALKDELADLHTPSVISNYSGVPGGSGPSRTTELVAVRELPTTKQRQYEAVRKAIALTERYKNGLDRLKVIKLVLWDRIHTLEGAALCVPCHYKTAQGRHNEFIRLAASNFGLMDE